jgi:hypothetical protein
MFYEGPPQRLTCRDERERGKKIPLLQPCGELRYLGRGLQRDGCGENAIPNKARPESQAGDSGQLAVERRLEGEPSIRRRCW